MVLSVAVVAVEVTKSNGISVKTPTGTHLVVSTTAPPSTNASQVATQLFFISLVGYPQNNIALMTIHVEKNIPESQIIVLHLLNTTSGIWDSMKNSSYNAQGKTVSADVLLDRNQYQIMGFIEQQSDEFPTRTDVVIIFVAALVVVCIVYFVWPSRKSTPR
jgi:hypothetical protein